jgi:hypothetical protein
MKGVKGMTDQQRASPDQHIVYRAGRWAIVPDGADEPIKEFETRDEALHWAARSMNHQGSTLIVHNEDGSINDSIRPEA